MSTPFDMILKFGKNFMKKNKSLLRIIDSEQWDSYNVLGAATITHGTIKALWGVSYIYYMFYSRAVAGARELTDHVYVDLASDFGKMLKGYRDSLDAYFKCCKNEDVKFPLDEQLFSPYNIPFANDIEKKFIMYIASYAILFVVLHEYSHELWKKHTKEQIVSAEANHRKTDEEIENNKRMENWCDQRAFMIFRCQYLRNLNRFEKNCAKVGVQMAFLAINSFSMDRKKFGGDHPESYNRIVNTLKDVSPDDDLSWSVLTAVLSYELCRCGEGVNQSIIHDNFKDAVLSLTKQLEAYDTRLKTSSEIK